MTNEKTILDLQATIRYLVIVTETIEADVDEPSKLTENVKMARTWLDEIIEGLERGGKP